MRQPQILDTQIELFENKVYFPHSNPNSYSKPISKELSRNHFATYFAEISKERDNWSVRTSALLRTSSAQKT